MIRCAYCGRLTTCDLDGAYVCRYCGYADREHTLFGKTWRIALILGIAGLLWYSMFVAGASLC